MRALSMRRKTQQVGTYACGRAHQGDKHIVTRLCLACAERGRPRGRARRRRNRACALACPVSFPRQAPEPAFAHVHRAPGAFGKRVWAPARQRCGIAHAPQAMPTRMCARRVRTLYVQLLDPQRQHARHRVAAEGVQEVAACGGCGRPRGAQAVWRARPAALDRSHVMRTASGAGADTSQV